MSQDITLYRQLETQLTKGERFVLVRVHAVAGSTPREAGAAMRVTATSTEGTIGGGHLEWKAIEQARAMLADGARLATRRRYPLGPALGQCCGGAVELLFLPQSALTRADWQRLARAEAADADVTVEVEAALDSGGPLAIAFRFSPWTVAVFGAGHAGRALVTMLSVTPCRVRWIDGRAEAFPDPLPANVEAIATDAPEAEATRLPPAADALVMTHSHALDLAICEALAAREDLGLVGLIGSETKAARFRARIAARLGMEAADRIICPVGDRSIASKHPGLIAAGIVAQLARERTGRFAYDTNSTVTPCTL